MSCKKEAKGTKPRSAMATGSLVVCVDVGGSNALEVLSEVLLSLVRAWGAVGLRLVVV